MARVELLATFKVSLILSRDIRVVNT